MTGYWASQLHHWLVSMILSDWKQLNGTFCRMRMSLSLYGVLHPDLPLLDCWRQVFTSTDSPCEFRAITPGHSDDEDGAWNKIIKLWEQDLQVESLEHDGRFEIWKKTRERMRKSGTQQRKGMRGCISEFKIFCHGSTERLQCVKLITKV